MSNQEHANQRQSAQGVAPEDEDVGDPDDQYIHLISHLLDY